MPTKPTKNPFLRLNWPDVTPLERKTVESLRYHAGWWSGDDNAIRVIREFAQAVTGNHVAVGNASDIGNQVVEREPDYDAPKPIAPMENWQRNDEHHQL